QGGRIHAPTPVNQCPARARIDFPELRPGWRCGRILRSAAQDQPVQRGVDRDSGYTIAVERRPGFGASRAGINRHTHQVQQRRPLAEVDLSRTGIDLAVAAVAVEIEHRVDRLCDHARPDLRPSPNTDAYTIAADLPAQVDPRGPRVDAGGGSGDRPPA